MPTLQKQCDIINTHIRIQMSDVLEALKIAENPDMKAEVYGKLLNGNGIKIRLTNVEYVDEPVIAHWKSVLRRKGYSSTLEHDISAGHVTINCKHRERISWTNIGIICLTITLAVRYFYNM